MPTLNTNPRTPAYFADILKKVRLMLRLMADNRVSMWVKAVPLITLIYLVSPLDFLFGPIDDLVVVYFGMETFISMCPPKIVSEHMNALDGNRKPPEEAKVIEGKFRDE